MENINRIELSGGEVMRPIGFYKTMEQIQQAFKDACKRNGWAETADNFKAYLHGLRVMRFTNL